MQSFLKQIQQQLRVGIIKTSWFTQLKRMWSFLLNPLWLIGVGFWKFFPSQRSVRGTSSYKGGIFFFRKLLRREFWLYTNLEEDGLQLISVVYVRVQRNWLIISYFTIMWLEASDIFYCHYLMLAASHSVGERVALKHWFKRPKASLKHFSLKKWDISLEEKIK